MPNIVTQSFLASSVMSLGRRFYWRQILPYLPAPAAGDAIPSPVHVYHVAERVKALRKEVSIQAVLGAGREATMRFYRI